MLNTDQVSHALQVSLGSIGRNNWVSAEADFSAKVFIDNVKELTMLVEDVVLDIQMFYFFNYQKEYNDYLKRRDFSKEKVKFLASREKHSYLGDIEDTEYISFASFCREGQDEEINFDKYVTLWENFNNEKNANKGSKGDRQSVEEIFLLHPKFKQLNISKIKRILNNLSFGEYILVRTEKKPKKRKESLMIFSCFGMKKWKTGRIKIVPVKHRFTYRKMMPYVSIFEFNWEGMENE